MTARDSRFEGVYAVTVTPFKPDLSIDMPALEQHFSRLIDDGVELLTVNGNTGEFYCLTIDEAKQVLACAVEVADGRAVIVAGVGHDVSTAINLARHAESLGCQAVMVHSPVNPYVTSAGFESYLRQIADAVEIAIIPYIRSPGISTDTILSIASMKQTVAIKYAVTDPARVAELAHSTSDVIWCCGAAETWAPTFFNAGATTFTSGLINIAPKLAIGLWTALRSGNSDSSRALWEAARPFERLRSEADNGFNVSVVKEALCQLNRCESFVRPPNGILDDSQKQRISRVISTWDQLGLL